MESYKSIKNNQLFIGGLNSYDTTEGSLKNFFEQWGEIVDVVVIKDRQTKLSRGFGFVTYAQSFMADEAMKNQPHFIDGRKVDTKRAVEQKDTDKPGIAANSKKMFIFNIQEQTEHDLFEYFEKFGRIISTKIVTDKMSGLRKGYGFIEYDNADSVDKAIFIKSHQVAGEKLRVEKSTSRNDGNGGGLRGRGGSGEYSSSAVGYNSTPTDEAWQDTRPIWCNYNPEWVNQEGDGYDWRGSQQPRSNYGSGENYGTGEGYGSGGSGGGYSGSVVGYNSNADGAWQDIAQICDNNNPEWVNQEGVGYSRGGLQQPSNNHGPNNNYGGGGPIKAYYTNNYRTSPYGNSGAGNVNTGNFSESRNSGEQY